MKYILKNPVRGVIGTEKFLTSVHWRNGVLLTDEPENMGGGDLGPDPFTLLLSSLVACTLASLRMYADLKGLNIPKIEVEANIHQVIGNEGLVAHIERRIFVPEVSDAELQQRLIRVAENCPVSKILKGTIRINSKLRTVIANTVSPQKETDRKTG
ncbi:OsmC family protein [Pedobacter sp. SYP-B3415]|uniref:OsmC family protein n=1 Tax=Pedobacter sp. SYP-B3415 TaxID=2496641 RepID=UPI00101D026B|nr:OsmC family protein [Pedobacter sp. SYP-B3415]